MSNKVRLQIISTENPLSPEQLRVDKVKILTSLNENMDEVTYFKQHFADTITFGNLVQIRDERPLTEVYEKLSIEKDVLFEIARPQIFFKKMLCTEDMRFETFANGCRVWLLEKPATAGIIKAAELFAEKKEDGTWIIQATWVEPYVIRPGDYIFYITTK